MLGLGLTLAESLAVVVIGTVVERLLVRVRVDVDGDDDADSDADGDACKLLAGGEGEVCADEEAGGLVTVKYVYVAGDCVLRVVIVVVVRSVDVNVSDIVPIGVLSAIKIGMTVFIAGLVRYAMLKRFIKAWY